MGKKRRKQNDEEPVKGVSIQENKEVDLSKNLSKSNMFVSNGDCTNIKRKKSKKHTINKSELDNTPMDEDKSGKAINRNKNKEIITDIVDKTSKKAKKKKHNIQKQKVVNIKSNEEKNVDDDKKTRKKRKQIVIEDVLANEENSPQKTQSEPTHIIKTGKKKQKLNITHNDEDSRQNNSIDVNNKDNTQNDNYIKAKKKRKQNSQEEVIQNEETNNDNDIKKTKKKRKRKIVVEEVINDEDIDKYCDELDPSYNKQYEDWVNLIEANLSSTK